MSIFMESSAPNPGFGQNHVLLFLNSCIGSGPNRSRIRIRHGRKYPRLIGILFFFWSYVRHSLWAKTDGIWHWEQKRTEFCVEFIFVFYSIKSDLQKSFFQILSPDFDDYFLYYMCTSYSMHLTVFAHKTKSFHPSFRHKKTRVFQFRVVFTFVDRILSAVFRTTPPTSIECALWFCLLWHIFWQNEMEYYYRI